MRPTEPKIRKIRGDLDKMRAKLHSLKALTLEMSVNPKGADVEICKQLRRAVDCMSAAAAGVSEAAASLESPERVLANRKRKETKR